MPDTPDEAARREAAERELIAEHERALGETLEQAGAALGEEGADVGAFARGALAAARARLERVDGARAAGADDLTPGSHGSPLPHAKFATWEPIDAPAIDPSLAGPLGVGPRGDPRWAMVSGADFERDGVADGVILFDSARAPSDGDVALLSVEGVGRILARWPVPASLAGAVRVHGVATARASPLH